MTKKNVIHDKIDTFTQGIDDHYLAIDLNH